MGDAIFKFLAVLLPFLKEMFFGEDTITDVVRKNKVATVLFFSNIILFLLLTYMSLTAIEEHLKVREYLKELEEKEKILNELIPAGFNDTDTLISIGKRINKLEQDKVYSAEQLGAAYDEMDRLAREIELCKTNKRLPRRPKPEENTPEITPFREDTLEELKRLLDNLKE